MPPKQSSPKKASPKKASGPKRASPKKAIVYTLKGCPWCVKCKTHLRSRGYAIKERRVERGMAPLPLPDGRTNYTYPQVYLFVGGYTETVKYIK